MKARVVLTVAAAAAVMLWVSAAGAARSGAGGPLAQGVTVGHVNIPASLAAGSQPRSLIGVDGVPAKGSYAFLLKLNTAPTGVAYYANRPLGRTAARAAVRDQLATVKAAESRVIAALPSGSKVLYQTHVVLAGVAVYTNVKNIAALQGISGVARVYPIAPKTPSNSYAVPLQSAPQVWQNYSDRGENASIAVIDTGIDYTHADFGGPGTHAAYLLAHDNGAEAAPADPSLFPTAKIPGGYDLVGDAYNAAGSGAALTPHPDPNPLDCNGHGSHTAGTAAGFGENSDGTTYTGTYDTSTPFSTMKIGPGMAPEAKIYAYRVFGCTGSTDVVGDAIDMAVDPNGDSDPSDHVSVISMSLGADYGSAQDGDSVISNAASDLGVSVVAAAGNAGDIYDVAGSPGNASKVIGVAATVDADNALDSMTVSAPAGIAGNYGALRAGTYNWIDNPDLSGDVVAPSSSNILGCSAWSAGDAAAVNGKIALVNRGTCTFQVKHDNAKNAGAIGLIVVNNAAGNVPVAMGGTFTIPSVSVGITDGGTIRGQLANGVHVTGTAPSAFHVVTPGNNDTLASFSSRGIRAAGNLKPDVAAVGDTVVSAANGTGNGGVSESGTSMATPMVAGEAALIRSQNPGWSPELVKADVMNTAGQDVFTGTNHTGTKYAPNRVGAGRINAQAALDNHVLAYVTDDPGAVSASFGPVAATANPTVLTKTIKVDNQGGSSETYTVSYEAITSVPGATYSVSPSSVTVAGGTSTTVTLTLTIDPTLLTKTRDATVAATQSGLSRQFVADASGRVLFTPQDSSPQLRLPVYSAPRPASTMTQAAHLDMPSGSIQTASLALSGGGFSQGSGSTLTKSLVSGFELQATSGALPACSNVVLSQCIHASDENAADLKYVGTTSNAPELSSIGDDPLAGACNPDGQCGYEYFAISTQGPWHTAASENEFDIYLDTNGDGTADYIAFNTRLAGTDVLVVNLLKVSTNAVVDTELINDSQGNTDTALFDSDTLVMPVWLPALGVTVGNSRIKYAVVTFGSFANSNVDSVGFDGSGHPSLSIDVLNPGVAVYGSFSSSVSPLLWADMPSTSLTVRRDSTAYAADNGQGVLMVHYHNVAGNKAQVLDIDSHLLTPAVDGSGSGTVASSPSGASCSLSCTPGWFASGSTVTLTATPDAGSRFAGWSGGGCSGTGTCDVTMDASKTVTATFILQHTLTVSRDGNGTGSVSSSPSGISCGSTCSSLFDDGTVVTLTATPAATSGFTGWSGGGCSGTGTCIVTMDAAKSVTATFTDLPPTVTITSVRTNRFFNKATVRFTGSDPGNGTTGLTFKCQLDSRAPVSCTSPYVFKKVYIGKHTVTVIATDSVGNHSAPAVFQFRMTS